MKNDKFWERGVPSKPGWYIVAVLYDNGVGYEAADYWDGEQGWTAHPEVEGEKVIAYIPLRKVLDAAQVSFPKQ